MLKTLCLTKTDIRVLSTMITNSSIDRITGHKPSIYQYCSAEAVMSGISHLSPFNSKETDIIAFYMNNAKYMYTHSHALKLVESSDSTKWTTSPKIPRIELIANLKDLIKLLESQNSHDVYISYEELCTYEEMQDEGISGPHYALHFSYISDLTVKRYDESVISDLTKHILQMRKDEVERNKQIAKNAEAKKKVAEREQQLINLIQDLQDKKITVEEFAEKSKLLE